MPTTCVSVSTAPSATRLPPVTAWRTRPAIVDLPGIRALLAAVEVLPGHPVVHLASRFLALTVQRNGEMRGARWSEFADLDGLAPVWNIPAARMKMKLPHTVPLSRQAVDVPQTLRHLTGTRAHCFTAFDTSNPTISEASLNDLLGRAGYTGRHVPHGWRSSFSTIMNDRRRADRAVISRLRAP